MILVSIDYDVGGTTSTDPSLSLSLLLSSSLSLSHPGVALREKEGVGCVIRFRADNTLKSEQSVWPPH